MIRAPLIRPALAAILIGMSAPTAIAAPPAAASDGEEEVSEKEVARSLELPDLVFPVFDDEYRLHNYLFVSARMVVADGQDTWELRDQAHIIRDAILRRAHKISLHKGDDFATLDVERASTECLSAANGAVGEDAFAKIVFSQIAVQTGA